MRYILIQQYKYKAKGMVFKDSRWYKREDERTTKKNKYLWINACTEYYS